MTSSAQLSSTKIKPNLQLCSRAARATEQVIETEMEDALHLCIRKNLSRKGCATHVSRELDTNDPDNHDCFVYDTNGSGRAHYHAKVGSLYASCSRRSTVSVDKTAFEEWVKFIRKEAFLIKKI